ncbi:MAG: hypothetical protein M1830_007142 [Pleopsidium flavum]|nr:MAG: hypothetical protein M1830_007142 [Pleopsidium flavum]
MTKAAVDALDSAQSSPPLFASGSTKATRTRILKTLQQLFIPQMKISKIALKVDDSSLAAIARIRTNFNEILRFCRSPSEDNQKIRLACNDDFLKPVEKTIEADPYGGNVPLMESLTFLGHEPPLEWIFWDEDWPNQQPGGGYFDQTKVQPQVPREGKCASNPRLPGFTLRTHEIITLCPNSFGTFPQGQKPEQTPFRLRQNLRNLQNSVTAGDYLDNYYSVSGVLLHELTHWVFDSDDVPALTEGGQLKQPGEPSYLWVNCRNLAKSRSTGHAGAENNADNYRLFATAMFLNAWDWHTGRAERPA